MRGRSAVLQTALQMLTGYLGYFLLLPGIFLSGLAFDRGTGILAADIGAYLRKRMSDAPTGSSAKGQNQRSRTARFKVSTTVATGTFDLFACYS